MGSRSPITAKASFVVAILTDPAECEALYDVLPAAY
jgi:hypothetical protein